MLPLVKRVLYTASYVESGIYILVMNIGLLVFVLVGGDFVVKRFERRRIGTPPDPVRVSEWVYAVVAVLMNSAVTVLGLYLFRHGFIHVRDDFGPRAWLDVLVLLFIMDVAMYVLHRVAHVGKLYALLHGAHHVYERPRPLDLFVLSPQENLAFGLLWLVVLMVYTSSWFGISTYLGLNLVFGAIGHLGVEPFPRSWVKIPGLRWIATSSFHAGHHGDRHHNFGFYTVLWDTIFGTLAPEYVPEFGPRVEERS